MGPLDVLAVIRAPLEQYPPSVNQVAVMAEAGLHVGVADCAHEGYPEILIGRSRRVERFRLARHFHSFGKRVPAIWTRAWRALRFKCGVLALLRLCRPKVIVAYDPYGIAVAGEAWSLKWRPNVVWHFHELYPRKGCGRSRLLQRAVDFGLQHAKHPDLIVFPDRFRAEAFQAEAQETAEISVVFNCPRTLREVPKERLHDVLSALGIRQVVPIVYFHGWIGPQNFLETLIEAMSDVCPTALLVLVGPVTEAYQESLRMHASRLKMRERVVFLGFVPLDQLDGLMAGATVGVSLFSSDTDSLNLRFLAGASNKRFQYMAVGLPQITNIGTGVEQIFGRHNCALLVNPSSRTELAAALRALLSDDTLRARLGENGRRAHLAGFNYEDQFAPVLSKLLSWIRG